MKNIFLKLLVLVALVAPIAAVAEILPVKEGYNVMGRVVCDGKGVADVVVSDGHDVVKTDAEGRYYLKTDVSVEPEVFVSIPSGYEAVGRKGTSSAFYHYVKNTDEVQTFNFELTPVDQTNYELLAIADSHVCSARNLKGHSQDIMLYRNLFIPAFREYGRKCLAEGRRVYAVHAGDFTQAAYWEKGYDIQDYCDDTAVVTEFPIFNAIGNHDHDHCRHTNGEKLYDDTTQHLSRLSFRKALGPAYYSINIGSEHIIFLDNMFIFRSEIRYTAKLDAKQMEWLKKDVAAIDRTKIKGIVVVAHSATYTMKDEKEMKALFDEFPQTYIIGHHHLDRTIISSTSTGKSIKEFLTPTLAGVAWLHKLCGDGTPRSFIAYNFKEGEPVRREFIPFDKENEGMQYQAYDNRTYKLDYNITNYAGTKWKREGDAMLEFQNVPKPAVLINMWGAVSCESVGKGKVLIEQGGKDNIRLYDPNYRDWFWVSLESSDRDSIYRDENVPNGYTHQQPYGRISHMWRITPSNPNKPVELLLKDAQGKETRVTLYAK